MYIIAYSYFNHFRQLSARFQSSRVVILKFAISPITKDILYPIFSINTDSSVIKVSAGVYVENNPIVVPKQVSIVGDSLREVTISPQNADKDFTLEINKVILGFFDEYLKNNLSNWADDLTKNYDTIIKFK